MSLTMKDASKVTQTLNTDTTASPGEHTPRHVPIPVTSGGFSVDRQLNLSTTGQVVKASAGQLYGWYFFNTGATTRYVKVYNKATAASSSDTPILTLPVPPGGGANVLNTIGIPFSTGISIRATTGVADNDNVAPGSNEVITNLYFK